jgi:geranylgeranyl diphosphate synthase type II
MIRLKTAVLLAGSLKIGAILGGASAEDVARLYEFGIQIGLAFQLQDDFLDVYGDVESFGKNIGGDILCNKKTYLLIKAFEVADKRHTDELLHWLTVKDYDNEEKISAVTRIYDELDIPSYCDKVIQDYYMAGIKNLDKVVVDPARKQVLLDFVGEMMHRDV